MWCLERLRKEYGELNVDQQQQLRSLLQFPGAEILWTEDFEPRSGYDEKGEAPFNRAINVHEKGVFR